MLEPAPSSLDRSTESLDSRRPAPITGTVVYGYFSHPCSYRVFLDLYGDRQEKAAPEPVGRYLMDQGLAHEAEVFAKLRHENPGQCVDVSRDVSIDFETDFRRRVIATRAAMESNVRYIFHGVLMREDDESRFIYRGETDLLERVDGAPDGVAGYRVGDVKSSRHTRFPQIMQVAFYSWILGKTLGLPPREGFIVTQDGTFESFDLEESSWTLKLFLSEEIPEYTRRENTHFHLEPSCASCPWRQHCRNLAEQTDDLSLVPGIRRAEKRALHHAGIHTRAALQKASDEELRRLGRAFGQKLDGFRDLKNAAFAREADRPMIRQHPKSMSRARAEGAAAYDPADIFTHNGMFVLMSSLLDVSAQEDTFFGVSWRHRDDIVSARPPAIPPTIYTTSHAGGDELDLLEQFASDFSAQRDLLRRNRQTVLLVLPDNGLRHRLRRVVLEGQLRHRDLSWIDDAVVLTEIVHRVYFLPKAACHIDEAAEVIPATFYGPRRTPRDPDDLTDHAFLPCSRDAALAALHRLETRARELGVDPAVFGTLGRGLRPLLLREWQKTRDVSFLTLLHFELAEEVRAADRVLAHLLKL